MNKKIPDIRFYDFNFNLLHTENDFLNSNWTIYYNDIGTFEAHFDSKSDALPIVMENDYLVAVQGNLSAIIVGKKVAGELIIYGRTCNWLLTKRITDAFESTTDTVDALVNTKVQNAFSDSPLVAEDTVPNPPTITIGRDDKCETFSLVRESLQLANLGHRLEFDPKESQWIFRILKGDENNPLVISTANRNAYDISIKSDALKACTQGWYKLQYQNMGEWDPEKNALLNENGDIISDTRITNGTDASPVPDNLGKYWKVRFHRGSDYLYYRRFGVGWYSGDLAVCDNENGIIKKSDSIDPFWTKVSLPAPETGILRWESILSAKSRNEALLSLYNTQNTNVVQGKTVGISLGDEEKYQNKECDYMLGDIVSLEWQSENYKKRARKRVTGVNLWYETESFGEEPIFEDVK